MARAYLKYGNYSSYLYVDYNFSVNGRNWTLTGGMYFYTGKANMGSWGRSGSTYLHTNNSGRGLAYTKAGNVYTVVDNFTIATGTYNNNGDAPSVTVGWSWGVSSSWGGYQNPSGTVTMTGSSIGRATYWNDINAYYPEQDKQHALKFDLRTSDGRSWTDLTNEPASFENIYGTTATISNIRPAVKGLHYTKNNVTNSAAASFSWTINTVNWAACMYTEWNTYTVAASKDYGVLEIVSPDDSWASGRKIKYGTPVNLLARVKPGYTWIGWAGTVSSKDLKLSFTIDDHEYSVRANARPNKYTIRYDLNGGSGDGYGFYDLIKTYDVPAKLTSSIPGKYGYEFLGWSTKKGATSAAYKPGQSITQDLTPDDGVVKVLYAVWKLRKPWNVTVVAKTTSPFNTLLEWWCDGEDILRYELYINGKLWYSGEHGSTNFETEEETTYTVQVAAVNPAGTVFGEAISLTTPADQAKIRRKVDGAWVQGKAYYKKDGKWIKVKKVYVKKNGMWVIGKNTN